MAEALAGVGLIVPPRDVREVLEKMVPFVARNPAIEAKIKEKKAGDPKFSFLSPADPYHAYYQSKVAAARAPAPPAAPAAPVVAPVPPPAASTTTAPAAVSLLRAARAREEAARPEPREPPPDSLFSVFDVSPAPHALALDVMKLTAQHAARHGRDFLAGLGAKEARNPLFDFLKPMHPHFFVFQGLVDAYSAIVAPPGGKEAVVQKLKEQAASREPLLRQVWYMHDWERQMSAREQEALMDESDRRQTAQIDWQDFVVLETVDIDDAEENLPAPVADAKQLPRILAAAEQARLEQEKNRGDVDMDVDADVPAAQTSDANIVSADVDTDIPADRVRRAPAIDTNGISGAIPTTTPVGPAPRAVQEQTVVLPSGQRVPLSQAGASMKAELLDPSYKEEQARAAQKNRLQNLAGGEEVARNLARLNQSRTEGEVYNRADIQGALAGLPKPLPSEADALLKKATPSGPQLPSRNGENATPLSPPAKRARVDAAVGALESRASGTAAAAPPADQIEDYLVPEPQPQTPEGLVSAEEWLKTNGDSSQVRIKVPVHGNAEWELKGQEIVMSVPLRSTVGKLKAFLSKETKLPANKQKLQYGPAGFMKDKMSLAFYNISNSAAIVLEVKERGGRKRKD